MLSPTAMRTGWSAAGAPVDSRAGGPAVSTSEAVTRCSMAASSGQESAGVGHCANVEERGGAGFEEFLGECYALLVRRILVFVAVAAAADIRIIVAVLGDGG